jgi:hypothetical protein
MNCLRLKFGVWLVGELNPQTTCCNTSFLRLAHCTQSHTRHLTHIMHVYTNQTSKKETCAGIEPLNCPLQHKL